MKKIFFFFVMLNLFQHFSLAQNQKIDSLLNILKISEQDTSKVRVLNDLAWEEIKQDDLDKALSYSQKAITISKKIKDQLSLASSYNTIGSVFRKKNNYKRASEYYTLALEINKQLNNKKGIAANLYNIGYIYRDQGINDKALDYYQESLKIRENIEDEPGMAASLNMMGITYDYLGEYERAINVYGRALKINNKLNNKSEIASNLHNMGIIYMYQGKHQLALKNFLTALKIQEELGNKKAMSGILSCIGLLNIAQKNNKAALKYFFESLQLNKETGNLTSAAGNLHNIGMIYTEEKEYEKALNNFSSALKINRDNGNQTWEANNLAYIGKVHKARSNYREALNYITQSYNIHKQLNNKIEVSTAYANIADIYYETGDFNNAKEFAQKSIEIAEEVGAKHTLISSYKLFSDIMEKSKSYKTAFEYYKLHTQIKDSLLNVESSKQLAEMQTKYDTDKKEKEIELLTKDKKLHSAALRQQTMQRNGFIAGFALMLALAGVSYRSYRNKRKAHAIITEQKELVEEKNKDITDSINYAKNIQQAILPFDYRIAEVLKEHFILFKPRDIVSGDFYWFTEKELPSPNGEGPGVRYIYLAVADCTGHGVPGAFMSMIGSATLTHAVSERGITEPAKILSEANRKIKEALKQTENNDRDGMDISLVRFEKNNINKIQFAGAMRTLYIVRKSSLTEGESSAQAEQGDVKTHPLIPSQEGNYGLSEVQGDKMAIGGTTEDSYQYTNHELTLQKGDTLYIFSDGYADQFGGNDGKKFRTGNFKKLLLSIQDKSMNEQKQILNESFETWKGRLEQVDDVCIIGVRV